MTSLNPPYYWGMPQYLPDWPYGTDPRQKLDLFLPDHEAAPLLLFVHGGGWRGGDKGFYRPLGEVLAHAGFAVALPNHRLAPDHPFPAAIEDVGAAAAALQRYAGECGLRRDGMILGGHSSGAHLAALLALHPEHGARAGFDRGAVGGVVCISGVFDLPPYAELAGAYLAPVFGEESPAWIDASPLSHVSHGVPPFFLACAEFDYPGATAQARAFQAALERAGGEAEFVMVPRRNHITILTGVESPLDPLAVGLTMFLGPRR